MHGTRRLAVHHTTGPANKVLAKGDPDLESSKPPDTHTKRRPFITRALRATLLLPATSQPASQRDRGSQALQVSTTHGSTYPLAEQQQQHHTQQASVATPSNQPSPLEVTLSQLSGKEDHNCWSLNQQLNQPAFPFNNQHWAS